MNPTTTTTPNPQLKGDQLPVAVLSRFGQNSTFRIFGENDLVRAFYRAKIKGAKRFDYLFKNYPFDTDGLSPHCRQLETAFFLMQQSRLLKRANPDLVEYSVSSAISDRYSKLKDTVETNNKVSEDLDELSNIVRSLLVESST